MTDVEDSTVLPQIGFLLGAGCSVEAGIPDMKVFLNNYMQFIKEKDSALDEFIQDVLEDTSVEGTPDLEDLMVSLDTIAGNMPFSQIIRQFRPLKEKYQGKDELASRAMDSLQDYISNTTFINDYSKLSYIKGFINLISDFQYDIPVFTVNYDTILEFSFGYYGIPYTDGFEPYWNPGEFEDKTKMHVYKLHGSCTWYSSGSSYIRIPIKPTTPSLEVLGLGETQNMVLYPTFSKNRMSEPLSVLLDQFRKVLGRLNALFIVGYSCRDEDIALVIAEALRVNPILRIFVVNPNPGSSIANLVKFDERIGDACMGMSTTWSILLRNNHIGRMIEDFAKGIREYDDIKIDLRYGDSFQNQSQNFYGVSRHLLRSFQYHQLLDIYSIIRGDETPDLSLNIDVDRDSYAFVIASLALLYKAILMDDPGKVSEYAKSLLDSFDASADKEKRGLTFDALVDEVPDELDSEHWVSGEPFYRIDNILGDGFKEWAMWVPPFLHADSLKRTLRPLAQSVINFHNDYDFLNNFRSYISNKAGGGNYEYSIKKIERLFPGISQRIDIPIDIDKILFMDIDNSENRNRNIIDDNPWLNEIYCDMIEQINVILNTLRELSKSIS